MSEYHIALEWARNTSEPKENRTYMVTYGGGSSMQASSPAEYSGDPSLPNPEEMLVAALSSCYMLTFAALVNKYRFTIEHYHDDATGIMGKNEQGASFVTEINLNIHVTFSGDKQPNQNELMQIKQKAHDYCFISNTIKSKINLNLIVNANT